MAKPTTELGQLSPPPPYTRWDQRGKPTLLSYLKLVDGKRLCLSLETQNPKVARRHMRLLVAWSLAEGCLSPDGRAAKEYGPKGTRRTRLNKIESEIRRLKGLPDAEYGSAALVRAKRWDRPVGIIHHLTGRKPVLSAGTYATRRMRARGKNKPFLKGDTWEHRPQGGKCYGWNGNVLTARVQIDRRHQQWPLKATNEQEAEALMAPVRVARKRLRRAAAEELNCELGTGAATAAAAERASARAELASAILKAGGPKELAEFVMKGPQEAGGTAVPQPVVIRRAERRAIKKAAQAAADAHDYASVERIAIAVDATEAKVSFRGGIEMGGSIYALIAALCREFEEDLNAGAFRDQYQFVTAAVLAKRLQINQPSLRQCVSRARKRIARTFLKEIDHQLDADDVIQNKEWKGYRLNPYLLLVKPAQLREQS